MKNSWPSLFAFGLTLVLSATVPSRGDEEEINLSDCPAAVRKTFREEAKGAAIESVTRETEDDLTTYWGSAEIGGKTYTIGVTHDGTLTEISLEIEEDEIPFSDCPEVVKKTFREESKFAKFVDVGREKKFGLTVYVTSARIGGKDYELKVAEDGTLTEKTLLIEEDEVEIADLPAAVRTRLRVEARGAALGEITRSAGIVNRVYTTGVGIQGKNYRLEIGEDGTLISKTLEEDD